MVVVQGRRKLFRDTNLRYNTLREKNCKDIQRIFAGWTEVPVILMKIINQFYHILVISIYVSYLIINIITKINIIARKITKKEELYKFKWANYTRSVDKLIPFKHTYGYCG